MAIGRKRLDQVHGVDESLIKRAREAFAGQRRRCYYKNNPRYSTYGAKGIRVSYTWQEFLEWYILEMPKVNFTDPVIGRIDHSKNYSFDNIEIQSKVSNSSEAINRNGNPGRLRRKKVNIYKWPSMDHVWTAESITAAAFKTKTSVSNVSLICRGGGKKNSRQVKGFTFRFA